jgi:hypothetical protein
MYYPFEDSRIQNARLQNARLQDSRLKNYSNNNNKQTDWITNRFIEDEKWSKKYLKYKRKYLNFKH